MGDRVERLLTRDCSEKATQLKGPKPQLEAEATQLWEKLREPVEPHNAKPESQIPRKSPEVKCRSL